MGLLVPGGGARLAGATADESAVCPRGCEKVMTAQPEMVQARETVSTSSMEM